MADSSVTDGSGSTPEQRARVGKVLRKSTQSCTECRRRKIRCSFPPNNRSLCIPCSTRGSRCIDQRSELANSAADERKTLRDRVARLESMLENVLRDNKEDRPSDGRSNHAAEDYESDSDGDLEADPASAPFMSVLNDSMGSQEADISYSQARDSRERSTTSPTSQHGSITHRQKRALNSTGNYISKKKTKSARVCEALRSSLPKYDEMMEIFINKSSWWAYWRQKTYGEMKPAETLPEYAARIFVNGKPTELGMLVSAFGLSSGTNRKGSQFLSLVDKLIISDDQYAATLSGLECILLQAKCYLDIGQPRKAWLSYRRGLTLAQLTNLHRTHRKAVETDHIWWALYQGDRFLSTILGLPYTVSDAHCDLGLHSDSNTKGSGMPLRPFTLRTGTIAGRVIDRTQAGLDQCETTAIEIDEEMQALAAGMPPTWWNLPTISRESSSDIPQLRQRLLLQVFFCLIRVYLNLPFLLDTRPNQDSRRDQCRIACTDSARMVMKRYVVLRTEVNGEPLYDCQTNDFVGFTTAVILLLSTARNREALLVEGDWALVEHTHGIFKDLSKSSSSKLFSQSSQALETLMGHNQDLSSGDTKVFIPYFGSVSVQQDRRLQKPPASSSAPSLTYQSMNSTTPGSTGYHPAAEPSPYANMTSSSSGPDFYTPPMQYGNFDISGQFNGNEYYTDFGAFGGEVDPMAWLNDSGPMMDIDQDWTWMEQ